MRKQYANNIILLAHCIRNQGLAQWITDNGSSPSYRESKEVIFVHWMVEVLGQVSVSKHGQDADRHSGRQTRSGKWRQIVLLQWCVKRHRAVLNNMPCQVQLAPGGHWMNSFIIWGWLSPIRDAPPKYEGASEPEFNQTEKDARKHFRRYTTIQGALTADDALSLTAK